MIGGDHLGVALGEVVLPAPVHSGAVAVEQPQLGQRIDAGGQRAKAGTAAHHLLECSGQGRRNLGRSLVSDQEHPLALLQQALPGLSGQAPAIAFGGLVGEHEDRIIERLGMQPAGRPQGLLGERQGQRASLRPEQETDALGCHAGRSIDLF
ncbi:hypothetical protein D9M71_522980 [compost metagenome]